MSEKFILDPCCGGRMMWFQKNQKNTIYGDIRTLKKGDIESAKGFQVNPDIIMDFRKMPFNNNYFKLVVFEPPHLLTLGKTSKFRKQYGCLNKGSWKEDLKLGFNECWRVLDEKGVLIFKWSNNEVPFREVLKLAPCEPLFGNVSNSRNSSVTKWFCFMKIPKVLEECEK